MSLPEEDDRCHICNLEDMWVWPDVPFPEPAEWEPGDAERDDPPEPDPYDPDYYPDYGDPPDPDYGPEDPFQERPTPTGAELQALAEASRERALNSLDRAVAMLGRYLGGRASSLERTLVEGSLSCKMTPT